MAASWRCPSFTPLLEKHRAVDHVEEPHPGDVRRGRGSHSLGVARMHTGHYAGNPTKEIVTSVLARD